MSQGMIWAIVAVVPWVLGVVLYLTQSKRLPSGHHETDVQVCGDMWTEAQREQRRTAAGDRDDAVRRVEKEHDAAVAAKGSALAARTTAEAQAAALIARRFAEEAASAAAAALAASRIIDKEAEVPLAADFADRAADAAADATAHADALRAAESALE